MCSNVTCCNVACSNLRVDGVTYSVNVIDSQLDWIRMNSNAPAYTWLGDTNTGMYHYSNDVIGFSTNSVQRILVGSNVGVNTITPSTALDIAGTASIIHRIPGITNYYPFDSSGADMVGTRVMTAGLGTPTYVTGVIGNAIRLNNSSSPGGAVSQNMQYLNANFTLPLSVSLWTRPESVSGADDMLIVLISSTDSSSRLRIQLKSTGLFSFVGDSTEAITSTTATVNTWYHLAITISSSGYVGYINGTPVVTSSTAVNWNNTNNLSLGGLTASSHKWSYTTVL